MIVIVMVSYVMHVCDCSVIEVPVLALPLIK